MNKPAPKIYPNLDESGEQCILTDNRTLHRLYDGKRIFVVKYFDLLKINPNGMYYDDQPHLSDTRHQVVADKIFKTI
ncbi:hypothetical protein C9426_16900 [Serratia sp. S1B]|nr:hypothetical protein C9426_16900 [Serratia sp. S1B]